MSEYHALFGTLVASALDRSDDAIVILELIDPGREGLVIIGMNDAFCRMSGFSYAEAVGRPFLCLARECDNPGVFERIIKAVEAAEAAHIELLCSRRDGSTYWLGMHVMPAGDPTEFGLHSVVLGRDITLNLKADQQQKAMQELLAGVFTSVDAAVALVSDDGRFLMVNPKMGKLLNYPAGSLEGTATLARIAPQSRPLAMQTSDRQLADGSPYSIDVSVLRGNGLELPTRWTSVVVAGRNAKRYRVITLTPKESAEPPRVQVAGKLQLIGLDEIRASLGARWETMVERVMQSAEHVIRRRLGAQDTFSRTADHAFLVCFAELSEQEAAFQAAVIAREIRARLIGQGEEPGASHVTAVTTSVPLQAGPSPSTAVLAQMFDARLTTQLAMIHTEARRTLQDVAQELHSVIEPVLGQRGKEVASYVRLPKSAECRLVAALAALPESESADFDLDALRLDLAAESCALDALQGSTVPVFVEVGFSVFDTRKTVERYLVHLRRLDRKLQMRLTLMLSQVPAELASARVDDCVQRLRPFCRQVGFDLADMHSLAPREGLPKGTVLSVDAAARPAPPKEQLMRLLAAAHRAHSKLMVRHVGSPDIAKALLTLGVDLVSFSLAGPRAQD